MFAADENTRQVPAVTAAAGDQSLGVDPGLGFEPLGRGNRVGVRPGQPVRIDRIGKGLTEAGRAVKIVPGRYVTPGSKGLRVPAEVKRIGDCVMWPAVNQQE